MQFSRNFKCMNKCYIVFNNILKTLAQNVYTLFMEQNKKKNV